MNDPNNTEPCYISELWIDGLDEPLVACSVCGALIHPDCEATHSAFHRSLVHKHIIGQ